MSDFRNFCSDFQGPVKAKFAEHPFPAFRRISLPILLSTRLPLLVAANIILLGDVPILTILYAVLVVGASDRRTHKEFAPMSRPLW